MRNRQSAGTRSDRTRDHDAGGWSAAGAWLAVPLRFLANIGWGVRDTVAGIVGIGGAVAILVNALFLQTGPHPAPLFKAAALAVTAPGDAVSTTNTVVVAVPRARPPEPVPVKSEPAAAARPPAEVVRTPKEAPKPALVTVAAPAVPVAVPAPAHTNNNDPIADVLSTSRRVMALQRALAQYGYGQLKPTGVVDPDTRAAIEKFERERKLPVTGQPSERVAKELTSITGRPID